MLESCFYIIKSFVVTSDKQVMVLGVFICLSVFLFHLFSLHFTFKHFRHTFAFDTLTGLERSI